MKQPSDFWDKHAAHYDRFLRRDMAAYQQMYELICPAVRHKTVLELATGTGLIASHIINAAEQIEATDASEEMIRLAKEANRSSKLHFSVQDMFHLPYADHSFDVAIVSNALHIVPQPEKALAEACRVLKDDGLLIVPMGESGGRFNPFSCGCPVFRFAADGPARNIWHFCGSAAGASEQAGCFRHRSP